MTLDPAAIPKAWPRSGDFTLPDWHAIHEWLAANNYLESEFNAIYTALAEHWLRILRDQLGGTYTIVKSKNFQLLTAQDASHSRAALQILEQTHRAILDEWDGVASVAGFGPHVVFMFDEIDDYYDYIGQYYPDTEEEFAGSSGMMIDNGYGHIAIATSDLNLCSNTLFHEMTHLLVAHLPLPLWVNEGLATSAERALTHYAPPLLNEELVQRHRNYWNEDTIQHFWNGDSFSMPGDAQELSYNLAEVLANQLRNIPGYRDFILDSTWEDAGNAAARQHLNGTVGDIAAIFLGDGPWDVNWADE